MALEEKGTAQQNAPSATSTQESPKAEQQQQAAGGGKKALSFANLLTPFRNSGLSSPQANEYVDTLTKILCDDGNEMKIGMKRIAQPAGVVFYHSNHAMVLTFAEGMHSHDLALPKSTFNYTAAQDARRVLGANLNILNVLVIVPQDYPKVNVMAKHIMSNLLAASSDAIANMTLDSLRRSQFTVDANINDVRAFMEVNCPHGILPRGDIGFVINLREENEFAGAPGSRGDNALYTPSIGVSAFVDMTVENQNGQMKFVPHIRITDIVSVLPTMDMAWLAISVAADLFIGKSVWLQQFNSFDPKEMNIGNLIDHEGKPFFCADQAQRNEFINLWCTKPAMSVDVTEGRARIPGIERLTSSSEKSTKATTKGLSRFLQVSIPKATRVAQPFFEEFVGNVQYGSEIIDSRAVDYLTCVNRFSSHPRLKDLLTRHADPTVRADLIQELMGDFKRLYVNQVCLLDPDAIKQMAGLIANAVRLNSSYHSHTGINVGSLIDQGERFGNGGFSVTTNSLLGGSYQSNWNTQRMGSIYGY